MLYIDVGTVRFNFHRSSFLLFLPHFHQDGDTMNSTAPVLKALAATNYPTSKLTTYIAEGAGHNEKSW